VRVSPRGFYHFVGTVDPLGSLARGAISTLQFLDQSACSVLEMSVPFATRKKWIYSSFGVDKARATHSAPRRASPSRTR
jgi:hypothetical protein